MKRGNHTVKKKKHLLSMGLCLGVLAITYGVGQAGFYVVPVVRNSASVTTCANDGYEVLSGTGRCWMAFNLGATQVATAIDDEAAYGDLYQWGRRGDGHERRNLNETTIVQSATDNPGHGNFIIGSLDWRTPRNDFFWQGIGGINNPCPQGFRLPTDAEWQAELDKYGTTGTALFNSPLKLVVAGYRDYNSDVLFETGTIGYYWSSTVSDAEAHSLGLNSDAAALGTYDHRAYGQTIRCIKD